MSVLGVLSRFNPPKRFEVVLTGVHRQGSPLWAAIPAGLFVAGDHPVFGASVLAAFLALLMLAFEAPIKLYGHLPVVVSFQMLCICAALVLFAILSIMPLAARLRWRSAQPA